MFLIVDQLSSAHRALIGFDMLSHYKCLLDMDRFDISFYDGAISHPLRNKSKIPNHQLVRTFTDVEIQPGAQSLIPVKVSKIYNDFDALLEPLHVHDYQGILISRGATTPNSNISVINVINPTDKTVVWNVINPTDKTVVWKQNSIIAAIRYLPHGCENIVNNYHVLSKETETK